MRSPAQNRQLQFADDKLARVTYQTVEVMALNIQGPPDEGDVTARRGLPRLPASPGEAAALESSAFLGDAFGTVFATQDVTHARAE